MRPRVGASKRRERYGAGWTRLMPSRITPKGERRFYDYETSKAIEVMREDGFYSFKYDFRPDAWERINKHGVKHGGGDAGSVLKTLFYVGLVAAYSALRACAH